MSSSPEKHSVGQGGLVCAVVVVEGDMLVVVLVDDVVAVLVDNVVLKVGVLFVDVINVVLVGDVVFKVVVVVVGVLVSKQSSGHPVGCSHLHSQLLDRRQMRSLYSRKYLIIFDDDDGCLWQHLPWGRC